MHPKQIKTDVGVIIGRFQVDKLHEGHKQLIEYVKSNHSRVIIVLGEAPIRGGINNPLDIQNRQVMISQSYPDVSVLWIKDRRSDENWSKCLDNLIFNFIKPKQTVTLYGGRDSFIKHYLGKIKTIELEGDYYNSGSEIRQNIKNTVDNSSSFRAGIIYASNMNYPTVLTTVDVAIFDKEEILLGRKKDEDKWRFIGGFANVRSPSFEADARREVQEETGLEITDPQYICSCQIDDWRYKKEDNKIKTLFFAATRLFGIEKANDDISLISWFPVKNLIHNYKSIIMDEHIILMEKLIDWKK